MNTFDSQREGSGTHEWAEVTENIARGCPHNCLYCYAAQNAKRFKLRDRDAVVSGNAAVLDIHC